MQVVGSQIEVHGHMSFIGNNAESHEGGALHIQAFGQIKVYTGSEIDFVNNTGRLIAFKSNTHDCVICIVWFLSPACAGSELPLWSMSSDPLLSTQNSSTIQTVFSSITIALLLPVIGMM